MEISFFDDNIEKYIHSLEKSTIVKVLRTLDLLEKFGYQLGMPHSRPIKGGLFELRIRGVQEARLIYLFSNNTIIIIHAFTKKTNKISEKDLKIALFKKKQLDQL